MRKFFLKKHVKNNRGFTLVEALVAVSLFTVSILSLMAVLADGISDTNYAKRKIIAVYLAQEGIEFTRNLRDTYMLYDVSGWTFLENKLTVAGCATANGCYYNDASLLWTGDSSSPIVDVPYIACGTSCPTLLFNSLTGKYNYTSGSNSGFIRKIRATVLNGDEIEISSTVFWTQGSGVYQATLIENLFNWTE